MRVILLVTSGAISCQHLNETRGSYRQRRSLATLLLRWLTAVSACEYVYQLSLNNLKGSAMKKTLQVIWATVLLLAIAAGCTATEEAAIKMDQPKQRISYTIGLNIGRDFARQEIDVDTAALLAGVRDGLGGQKPRLTDEEMQTEVKSFREAMMAKQEAKLKALADKNQTEGAAF